VLPDEFAEAIARFLQDELDDDTRVKLLRTLEQDPNAAAAFIAHVRVANALTAQRTTPDLAERVRLQLAADRGSQRIPAVRVDRAEAFSAWRTTVSLAAAALVVIAVTVVGALHAPSALPLPEASAADEVASCIVDGHPSALSADGSIEAAHGKAVTVQLRDGSMIECAGPCRLSVRNEHESFDIQVDEGVLTAQVAKRDPHRPLRFRTPDAIANVLGTRLRLRVSQQGTDLAVDEGLIQFTAPQGSLRLAAGFASNVARGTDRPTTPVLAVGVEPAGGVVDTIHAAGDWAVRPGAGATMDATFEALGPGSGDFARVRHHVPKSSWGWFGHVLQPIQDWSRAKKLAFWCRASDPKSPVRLELGHAALGADGRSTLVLWQLRVQGIGSEWGLIEVPLSGFMRSGAKSASAVDDLLDISRIRSVGFFVDGDGEIDIDHLHLVP
jgi:hypothetical protein